MAKGGPLKRLKPERSPGQPLYTRAESRGRVRLEAVFDPGWENAHEIGLLLCAEPSHSGKPTSLAATPNAMTLATGDDQGTVRLWDAQTGRLKQTWSAHPGPLHSLACMPDGQTLLTAGEEIRLWELATGKRQQEVKPSGGRCTVAACSPDGRFVALGTQSGSVELWSSGAESPTVTLGHHEKPVSALAFDAAGSLLASGGEDGKIVLWDLPARRLRRTLNAQVGRVLALAIQPGGNLLAASGAPSGGVETWDILTGQRRSRFAAGTPIGDLHFMPDGKKLIAAHKGSADMWDPVRGVHYIGCSPIPPAQDADIVRLARGANASTFFALLEDGTIYSPTRFVVEIRRDRTQLQTIAVSSSALPAERLRLEAEKVDDLLRFKVGALAAIEFRDPFSYRERAAGTFGVLWPSQARLIELRALHQAMPETASPMEEGDALYTSGQYAAAAAAYRRQAAAGHKADTLQESRYKEALCLIAMDRANDAESMLESLAAEPGDRWPVLAAAQLWLDRVRQGRHAEADALFESLSARCRVEQLVALVPSEIHGEIVAAYASEGLLLNFYKPNPDLIAHCRRAVAIAEYFHNPFLIPVQQALIRAYRVKGHEEEALQYVAQLVQEACRQGRFWEWYQEYAWLLRAAGRADKALEHLQALQAASDESRTLSMRLETARTLATLNRWEEAEKAIEEYFQKGRPRASDVYQWIALHAVRGFLREQRGDLAGAQQAWREGVQHQWKDLISGLMFVDGLILASLTGEISEADAEQIRDKLATSVAGDEAIALLDTGLAENVLSGKSLASIIREAFRRPRGKEFARRFVFRQLPFRDCVRMPACLLASEFVRQKAFANELTEQQEEVVWQFAEQGFAAAFETGKLKKADMLQAGFAWKGMTNFLGWGGLAPRLARELRGPAAYVLAHRYLQLDRRTDAAMLLQTAFNDAPEGSPLKTLAKKELGELGVSPETQPDK